MELDFDVTTADAIFTADSGAVTAPVEGLGGYNVFRITSITEGSTITLDDVRAELTDKVKREKAIDAMFDFLPDLEDAIAEEGSITAIAARLNLDVATVSAVDNQGRNVDGNQVITQPIEQRLLSVAFVAEQGAESDLTDLNPQDNTAGSFLLEVTETFDPEEQPFEDVSSEVRTSWLAEQRQQKAGELADAALARVVAGGNVEEIAADVGGISFDAKNLARVGGENSNLSASIRRLIFSLGVDQADVDRSADGDGYVIVRVTEIVPGDPATQTAESAVLMTQLAQSQQDTLLAQYQQYLMAKNPPEINGPLIEQLFPRDQ